MRFPAADAAPDSRKRGASSSVSSSSASPGASLRLQRSVKKPRRFGTRGAGFSAQEVDALLRVLRERLPLSKEEWEDAARVHVERFPDLDRTVDALRRKFARLHRTRAEDDDVRSLPKDAQVAKAVLEAMTRRAGASADGGAYAALMGRHDGDDSDENVDDASNDGSCRPQSMEPSARRDVEPDESALEVEQLPPGSAGACPHCQQLRPASEMDNVMAMLRVSMLQMQQQREQDAADRRRREALERERREEERRRREEDRAADRQRLDSLLAMVAQSHKTVEMLVLALMKDRRGGDSDS